MKKKAILALLLSVAMCFSACDIDEWEDMLPVERRYEKEHSFSNCSSGKVPGWMIVCFLL